MDQKRPAPPPPNRGQSPVPPVPIVRKSMRIDAATLAQQMAALDVDKSASSNSSNSNSNSASTGDGNTVWVADETEIWKLHEIVSQDNTKNTAVVKPVSKTGVQKDKTLPLDSIFKFNSKVSPDITSLTHIHEPAILYNLKERSAANHAYTFMASALVAVNPLKR